MMKVIGIRFISAVAFATLALSSCSSKNGGGGGRSGVSDKTGWNYNDPDFGGFEVADDYEMEGGPGTVFVQGGRFTMGRTYDDVNFENNARPRSVTVSSFYMDETEVANVHYREYTYWLNRTYGSDYPDQVKKALPDSNVWRSAFSYNEPMVKYYFRHAAFNYYPVVGVSWEQANAYCQWRTDRVNEKMAIDNGYLEPNPDQTNEDNFNTDSYVTGLYEGEYKSKKYSYDPNVGADGRNLDFADGILLPAYRLPTEAEWEFAALALIGENPEPANSRRTGEDAFTDRQVYPWANNDNVRWDLQNQYQGQYLANFNQGNGSYMGVPGGLNDNADRPNEIYSYVANAIGLYNMAGNVSEWTLDVYRDQRGEQERLNPYRGNEFTKVQLNSDGVVEELDSLGHITVIPMKDSELLISKYPNVRYSDLRGYLSGDIHNQGANDERKDGNEYVFEYNKNVKKFSNISRVYKGGSWKDRAYWLMPSARRYLDQSMATSTIGFRCVMDRLGSSVEGKTKNTSRFSK